MVGTLYLHRDESPMVCSLVNTEIQVPPGPRGFCSTHAVPSFPAHMDLSTGYNLQTIDNNILFVPVVEQDC